MNRRKMLLSAFTLLLVASPAFAYDEAVLSPDHLALRVGEKGTIGVRVEHRSGLNYTMWGFDFRTNNPDAVELEGELSYRHPNRSGEIYVRALAPGLARIISGGKTYAIVEVSCGVVEPVKQIVPVITAKKGERVTLAVTSGNEANRSLRWYAGRVGDRSRLLAADVMDVPFTPTAPGTHYVWVAANSPCAESSAEFRIDVPSSRQRAVRH